MSIFFYSVFIVYHGYTREQEKERKKDTENDYDMGKVKSCFTLSDGYLPLGALFFSSSSS